MTDDAGAAALTAATLATHARPAHLSAVVIGATGAIGKYVVAELLQRPQTWGKVTTIVRRPWAPPADVTGIDMKELEISGRLVQQVVDLNELSGRTDLVGGHTHAFSALGTTLKAAGSVVQEAFRAVDFGINTTFAQACKTAGVPNFSLVSSGAASPDSWYYYLQVKGMTESAIRGMEFPTCHIYRPGVLDKGADSSYVESFLSWTRIFPVSSVKAVAVAMVNDAERAAGVAAPDGRPVTVFREPDAIDRSASLSPLPAPLVDTTAGEHKSTVV